jgi:periplasmic protein TonB
MMKNIICFCLFSFFLSTGFSQEGVNVKGNSVSTKDIAPVWPGCEKVPGTSKDCFNKMLNEHIKKNFKYPKNAKGELIRGRTVLAFSIDETGKIKDIKAEGPHKEINEEAIRITKLFPQMKPGIRGGNPVSINYKMPFNF